MTEDTVDDVTVLQTLAEEGRNGNWYLKAKDLASKLETTPKTIGQRLGHINETYQEMLESEEYMEELPDSLIWGNKAKSSTWYAQPFAEYDGLCDDIEPYL